MQIEYTLISMNKTYVKFDYVGDIDFAVVPPTKNMPLLEEISFIILIIISALIMSFGLYKLITYFINKNNKNKLNKMKEKEFKNNSKIKQILED